MGRKTKEECAESKKTKERSAEGRMTSIFVIFIIIMVVDILLCLLTSFYFGYVSFCFGCSFLTLLVYFYSLILFLRIFIFIFVILDCSNSFHNGTVILVQIGRSYMESFVRIKLGIRGTVF